MSPTEPVESIPIKDIIQSRNKYKAKTPIGTRAIYIQHKKEYCSAVLTDLIPSSEDKK